jgi:hypothetical protein
MPELGVEPRSTGTRSGWRWATLESTLSRGVILITRTCWPRFPYAYLINIATLSDHHKLSNPSQNCMCFRLFSPAFTATPPKTPQFYFVNRRWLIFCAYLNRCLPLKIKFSSIFSITLSWETVLPLLNPWYAQGFHRTAPLAQPPLPSEI